MFARALETGAHLHYMLSVYAAAAVEKPRSQGGMIGHDLISRRATARASPRATSLKASQVKRRTNEASRVGLEWVEERFLIEQWRERRLPVAGGVCTRH